MPKTYIGDGVYCEVMNGEIILTTEDGVRKTNTIFLEPYMIEFILTFLRNQGVIK